MTWTYFIEDGRIHVHDKGGNFIHSSDIREDEMKDEIIEKKIQRTLKREFDEALEAENVIRALEILADAWWGNYEEYSRAVEAGHIHEYRNTEVTPRKTIK